jgi:hypothetical protein
MIHLVPNPRIKPSKVSTWSSTRRMEGHYRQHVMTQDTTKPSLSSAHCCHVRVSAERPGHAEEHYPGDS